MEEEQHQDRAETGAAGPFVLACARARAAGTAPFALVPVVASREPAEAPELRCLFKSSAHLQRARPLVRVRSFDRLLGS